MLRLGAIVATALISLLGAVSGGAQISSPGVKQVWATQTDRLLKEPAGWPQPVHHETAGLAFSNDGKKLAVTVTHNASGAHLLVIDVQFPEERVQQFDLPERCGADVSWNESGDAILVCGALVQLKDRKSCVVSPSPQPSVTRFYSTDKAFWLDSRHVVRGTGEILDMECEVVGMWPLDQGWRIGLGWGTPANSENWFILSQVQGQPPKFACMYSIVSRVSKAELSGLTFPKSLCSVNRLVDVGREELCFAASDGNRWRLRCVATNGGREIAIPKQLRDYEPIEGATLSSRLVSQKWGTPRFAWESPPVVMRRVIFDIDSGKEIAAWKPRLQISNSPVNADRPYRCAISPGGEYLTESGDGNLEYYRLAP